MDSFFGIGPLELIFILIFALIFLGPERLPGAVRQIASVIRQIQKLSGTLTQQLGDEFGDIRELDPRYQLQQMLDEPDEKEKAVAKKAEEKKKEDEKKKTEAKQAEEKRKAEAKKKADEAKKKAEEAKKAAEAKKNEEAVTDALVADGQVEMAPVVAEDTTLPSAVQPKQRSADEQTSPASAPFVKQKAEAQATATAGGEAENTIAPPVHRNHTGGEGNTNGASDGAVVATEIETAETPVVKEEQA